MLRIKKKQGFQFKLLSVSYDKVRPKPAQKLIWFPQPLFSPVLWISHQNPPKFRSKPSPSIRQTGLESRPEVEKPGQPAGERDSGQNRRLDGQAETGAGKKAQLPRPANWGRSSAAYLSEWYCPRPRPLKPVGSSYKPAFRQRPTVCQAGCGL